MKNRKLYLEQTADVMSKSYYYELWDYEYNLRESQEMNREIMFTSSLEEIESIFKGITEYVMEIYEENPDGFSAEYPRTVECINRLCFIVTHWDEFGSVIGIENSDLLIS